MKDQGLTRKLVVDDDERARIDVGSATIVRSPTPDLWAIADPGTRVYVVTLRRIPGWEFKYAAGDDGHVYRMDRGTPQRIAETGKTSEQYRGATLCGRGRAHKFGVHSLVCRAFYGLAPEWMGPEAEVRHLDGDRSNNVPENLDWGTPSQNWADRRAHGRGVHDNHHRAKLTMAKAEEIRASRMSSQEAALKYGVTRGAIEGVRRGRSWLKTEPPPPNLPRWSSRLFVLVQAVEMQGKGPMSRLSLTVARVP